MSSQAIKHRRRKRSKHVIVRPSGFGLPGGRSPRKLLEPLEQRLLLTAFIVNDNWDTSVDNGSPGLDVGDEVINNNDTQNPGTITAIYGVDGYGTITTGTSAGSLATFDSIEDVIAAAVADDTIDVLEGTYTEGTLGLDKVGLTLQSTDGALLTTIESSHHNPIAFSADNTTFDGFTLTTPGGTTPSSNIIRVGRAKNDGPEVAVDGVTIQNNIIRDFTTDTVGDHHAGIAISPLSSNVLIDGNTLMNLVSTVVAGNGVHYDGITTYGSIGSSTGGASNITITNNTIDTITSMPGFSFGAGINIDGLSGFHIECNTIRNVTGALTIRAAILIQIGDNIDILRNTLEGSVADFSTVQNHGVVMDGTVTDVLIEENFINDGSIGIWKRFGSSAPFYGGEEITAHANDLSNNTKGIKHEGFGSGVIDAQLNWWGTTDAATIVGNVLPSSKIDTSNFLMSGVDTETETCGFQPDLPGPSIVDWRTAINHGANPQSELIVDNLDGDFNSSGAWGESGAADEYNSSSLWTSTPGDTATWTPVLNGPGTYEVYAWWATADPGGGFYNRDDAARYTINYSGGSVDVVVNQDNNSGQWVLLDTVEFANTGTENLTLTRDTDASVPGSTSADAARFVQLSEAKLQVPDDGTFSESRHDGLSRLLVQFDESIDPATFTSASVKIAGNDVTNTDIDLSGVTITTSTRQNDTVGVIDFSPALPDFAKYNIRLDGILDPSGNPLKGDNDRIITALEGDTSGDRRVTSADYVVVRNNLGDPIDATVSSQVRTDGNTDGRVTSADYLVVSNKIPNDARGITDPVLSASSSSATTSTAQADDVLAGAKPTSGELFAAFRSWFYGQADTAASSEGTGNDSSQNGDLVSQWLNYLNYMMSFINR